MMVKYIAIDKIEKVHINLKITNPYIYLRERSRGEHNQIRTHVNKQYSLMFTITIQ